MSISSLKERDFAIDIVKAFAVLLIINSHADQMYPPPYRLLATGGAIGDCLFLFCSGFTLFMGRMQSFDNYYKRRINRIYPSVWMALLFACLVSGCWTIGVFNLVGAMFIRAIMIYYVLLYLIRRYAIDHIKLILSAVAIVTLAVYVLWFPYKYEVSSKGIYGITTLFRWIPYFAAMLLGAWVGMKRKDLKYNGLHDFVIFAACLVTFYAIQFAAKKYPVVAPWQIVTLLPLMGIVVYFYKWCNNKLFSRIYQSRWGNRVVMFVGGLCLESYLIQYSLFTDKMNGIWPLNILIIIVTILACSYMVRCISRAFSQTFRTEEYEWKEVFRMA